MRLRRAPGPSDADVARRLRTHAALERDELPPDAVARLRRAGPFGSIVSVGGFAALDRVGVRPVAPVFGAAVLHVVHQPLPSPSRRATGMRGPLAGGATRELAVWSGAWNEARGRALRRLREEARVAGADGVVGVRLDREEVLESEREVPYVQVVASGTAVTGLGAPDEVALAAAGAADCVKLLLRGWRPVDLVAASSATYVVAGYQTLRADPASNPYGTVNTELRDYTRGTAAARARAVARVEHAARAAGADGLVGVTYTQSIEPVERRGIGGRDLLVVLHVVATAIARTAARGATSTDLVLSVGGAS